MFASNNAIICITYVCTLHSTHTHSDLHKATSCSPLELHARVCALWVLLVMILREKSQNIAEKCQCGYYGRSADWCTQSHTGKGNDVMWRHNKIFSGIATCLLEYSRRQKKLYLRNSAGLVQSSRLIYDKIFSCSLVLFKSSPTVAVVEDLKRFCHIIDKTIGAVLPNDVIIFFFQSDDS